MGSRANYVIVTEDGYELYYTHWGAQKIDYDFCWGPERAIAFIRQHDRVEPPNGWLDDRWAEGVVLVDPSKRLLLLDGGEEIYWSIQTRRFHFALLAHTWPGWEARWASEGIVDAARYVGVDERLVIEQENHSTDVSPAHSCADPASVCSVRHTNGSLCLYPLDQEPRLLIRRGQALVSELARLESLDRVDGFPLNDVFAGGLHLDLARRRVLAWSTSAAALIRQEMAHAFPGWTTRWARSIRGARRAGRWTDLVRARCRGGHRRRAYRLAMQRLRPDRARVCRRYGRTPAQRGE
jgi:hypothetical protein